MKRFASMVCSMSRACSTVSTTSAAARASTSYHEDGSFPAIRGGIETTWLQQADGSSLMTVLREQLGLKLQSAPGPVEVLVIDNVETPSPNRSIGASAFPRHVLRALVVAESDEP